MGAVFFLQCFQELFYFFSVFQHDGLCVFRLGDPGVVPHPVLLVKIPDPLDKVPVEPLRAALCHVRPDFSVIAEDPLEHSQQAGPAAEIQIDDGIAFPEPCFHGSAVYENGRACSNR